MYVYVYSIPLKFVILNGDNCYKHKRKAAGGVPFTKHLLQNIFLQSLCRSALSNEQVLLLFYNC